jgi:hypothetical protein
MMQERAPENVRQVAGSALGRLKPRLERHEIRLRGL